MNKKIIFSPNAPLNPKDTEKQTYGCRQTNPEICRFNSMQDVCAFVQDDNICRHPARGWMKKYQELVGD